MLDAQSEQLADDGFVTLLDSFAAAYPVVAQLQAMLVERGWHGWTLVERA